MHNHRSKLFIYPEFQGTLLLYNFVITLMVFVFLSLGIYGSFEALISLGKEAKISETHAFFKFLSYHKTHLFKYVLVGFITSLALSSLAILRLSHRLAGPLVRLMKHMRLITSKGHFEELNFREGDYFSELPKSINNAFMAINKEKETKE